MFVNLAGSGLTKDMARCCEREVRKRIRAGRQLNEFQYFSILFSKASFGDALNSPNDKF